MIAPPAPLPIRPPAIAPVAAPTPTPAPRTASVADVNLRSGISPQPPAPQAPEKSHALGILAAAAAQGEQPVLQTGEEDGVELEALGRVEGGELHRLTGGAGVGVGEQCDLVHEAHEVEAPFAGLGRRGRGER